jgi:hypothetical protein
MLIAVSILLGITGFALIADGWTGQPFSQLVLGRWGSSPAPAPGTPGGAPQGTVPAGTDQAAARGAGQGATFPGGGISGQA